ILSFRLNQLEKTAAQRVELIEELSGINNLRRDHKPKRRFDSDHVGFDAKREEQGRKADEDDQQDTGSMPLKQFRGHGRNPSHPSSPERPKRSGPVGER